MKTSELLKNTKTKGLSGNAFKAYYVLLSEAKNQKIENFTILGLVKKWTDDAGLKMNTSRNTVKSILRELEELGLITNDQDNKVLYFNE